MRWSDVGFCVDSLFKQIITGPLMEVVRTDEMAAAASQSKDLRAMMLDRSQRFQAPPPVQPTGRWPTQADSKFPKAMP